MRNIIKILIVLILLSSCKTQPREYFAFETYKSHIIGSNVDIKMFPKKEKIVVKIFRNKEIEESRVISKEKYQQILDLYSKISIKDTSKVVSLDATSINIKYQKGDDKKNFYYTGIPRKGETFREVVEMILEIAKMEIKDID